MIVRVEKVEGGYAILLPPEIGKDWELHDGSAVEVHRVGSVSEVARYTSTEEVLEAHARTLPLYDEAYRELAKGPRESAPMILCRMIRRSFEVVGMRAAVNASISPLRIA